MEHLNENYTVTLVNKGGDHLKAVADDGVHGPANCQIARNWHGISRSDFKNAGAQLEVANLQWTGKFYRVKDDDIIGYARGGQSQPAQQSTQQNQPVQQPKKPISNPLFSKWCGSNSTTSKNTEDVSEDFDDDVDTLWY